MGEPVFGAPRLVRRGYDTRQVNAFVVRIDATLRGATDAPVTARDLATASFLRVTPLGQGYACDEVDAYLSEVSSSVIRANAARPAALAAIPQPREPRTWLGRLVHRPH